MKIQDTCGGLTWRYVVAGTQLRIEMFQSGLEGRFRLGVIVQAEIMDGGFHMGSGS